MSVIMIIIISAYAEIAHENSCKGDAVLTLSGCSILRTDI